MTSNTEYRYATAEDLKAFYKDDPLHYSARAVVVVKDGEVVGVGGVSRVDNKMLVFTEGIAEKLTKKDYINAGKLLMPIINRYTSVIAIMSQEEKTAEGFGRHFGFEKTGAKTADGEILMRVNK
jgi:hypothetical protein